VFDVPRSIFYHAAQPTQRSLEDAELAHSIHSIFRAHRGCYGYRRIWKQLGAQGIVCAPARVRRLMEEHSLLAIQPKSFRPTTSDGRADAPSPNLLLDQPLPTLPNQVWAGDIAYIPVGDRFLYLAVVIDLWSRRIVGWALADHLRSELVVDAMKRALESRRGTSGLIFHSDRGSQLPHFVRPTGSLWLAVSAALRLGSKAFCEQLKNGGVRQNMSARANPYHNAWTEPKRSGDRQPQAARRVSEANQSFMGTLKAEMLQKGRFIDAADAHAEIFAFIDGYYNTQRLHCSLNYRTPKHFEAEIALAN
jgi:transposase InsO family protein